MDNVEAVQETDSAGDNNPGINVNSSQSTDGTTTTSKFMKNIYIYVYILWIPLLSWVPIFVD